MVSIKKIGLVYLLGLCTVLPLCAQSYQFFRGNIHAHTTYSDGGKDAATTGVYTPLQAYNFAKQSLHFDFLGISDHNHATAGMAKNNYHLGVQQAAQANDNGDFVAFYGMEWGTISDEGHSLIYGVDSVIGWEAGNYDIFCAKGDYTNLFALIAARPNAWMSLAHPQTGDYHDIMTASTPYSAVADAAISGLSIRSGSANSTTLTYSDPAATSYESRFRTLLSKGYKLSPSIDNDNHYTTFGRNGEGRTVVLARSLHRDSIMQALKQGRYYAADDWNVDLHFTLGTHFMGSTVQMNDNPTLSVSVMDGDNEAVSKIEIFFGVPGSGTLSALLASNTNSTTLNYTHVMPMNATYYYYVKVTQADGDLIWSAPIWYTKTNALLPIELRHFTAKVRGTEGVLNWEALQTSVAIFEVEKSTDGSRFETIGTVKGQAAVNSNVYEFIDKNVSKGVNFYRLRQIDADGSVTYSPVVSVYFVNNKFILKGLSPNPASDVITLHLESGLETEVPMVVYNNAGQEMMRQNFRLTVGDNQLTMPITDLETGFYIVFLGKLGDNWVETRFVKE